jgi:hypothetical protein
VINMPEEQTKEEEDKLAEEKKEEEEGNHTQTDSPSAIEMAEKLRDQMKAENDRRETLLEREEKLHAERMLGGHSQAGQSPPPPKELTDKEYAAKVLAGETPE